MNLKLSYRDKVIFIVVMVILVLVAGFFLFIKPKFEAVERDKAALEAKQQEKTDIDTKIGTLPDLIDSLKETAKEIGEKQKIFLDEGHPYVNETYIREIFKELNVEVTDMTTQYTAAESIDRYIVNRKNVLAYDNKISADLYNELPQEVYDEYNRVAPVEYPSTIIGITRMSVTFNSDIQLNDAYKVMDRMAEDEKTIILNTISTGEMNEENAEPERNVSIDLTMYSIFPLNVEKVLEETDEVKPLEQTAPEETSETTAAE